MGRTSYALMSLIAAVPAGILVLILVMAFLQSGDAMPGMLIVVTGVALLIAALMAVTPVGILLFGGPKAAEAPSRAAAATEPVDTESSADESFVTDESFAEESVEVDDDWDGDDSAADFDEGDSLEGDEFEFDDGSSGEFDADFDFDDDQKK